MLTHFYTRVTYFVKGMLAPPLTYWSTNLSIGIAFLGVEIKGGVLQCLVAELGWRRGMMGAFSANEKTVDC